MSNTPENSVTEFTVVRLKDKLRERGLLTTGNKAELISRLDEADPSGAWRMENPRASASGGETTDDVLENLVDLNISASRERSNSILRPDAPAYVQRNVPDDTLRRELEFMRREKELLERELSLARREAEALRVSPRSDMTAQGLRCNASIKSIGELLSDFNAIDQSFDKWKKQLTLLISTYEMDEKSSKILFSSKLKGIALNWFHSRPEHLEMDVDTLLRNMGTIFDQRMNRLERRRDFEGRTWQEAENFSQYYYDKLILANNVPVCDEEIVDYIIDGITDANLRNQARMHNFQSAASLLEAFKNISLQAETKPAFKRNILDSAKIHAKPSKTPAKGNVSGPMQVRCYNCNRQGHFSKDCRLPRREKGSCFSCGGMGHAMKDCPKKNKQQVNLVREDPVAEDEFLKNVEYTVIDGHENYRLHLNTLIDTGSPISFIKESFVRSQFEKTADSVQNKFSGINGSELRVLGTIKTNIVLDDVSRENVSIFVVPDDTMLTSVVLGRNALKLFGIKLSCPERSKETVNKEIREIMNININSTEKSPVDDLKINSEIDHEDRTKFLRIFTKDYVNPERPNVPKVHAELRLNLHSTKPFHFAPRRLAYTEKDKLRKILDQLLERGIIRPSESEYASPVVLVKKKNGELRMCVDFRELNKVIARDNYPLPLIEDHLSILHGKKYFSTLDLKDGFHHIRVANDSIKYTSFTTPLGQYEYLQMPFGLKTAPSRFQRFVNQAFSELIQSGDVVVYMDDVLVATRTMEHHLQLIKRVFAVLVSNKMELRLDKCRFLCTKIEYLGYFVTEEGISPTREGIEAIKNFPLPQSTRDVQSYVGLCSYFRKFIEKFAFIAQPLYNLLKKDVPFKLGQEELKAFELLKSRLIAAPILAIYSSNDETELHCDASAVGFGAILMQRKADAKFHPIFYFSKRTTDTESRYHSFELETLAMIYALRRFRVYLQGLKFKIITDCNSVRMTLNKKEINPRIARWALELQNFDYEVEHRPGTHMAHVDALSRTINVLVLEDNSFEFNLSVCQDQDAKIRELRTNLESREDSFFEMRNGIIYRKKENQLLFYVPENMEKNVIFKYHDEMGHFGIEKTSSTILQNYWFPKLKGKVAVHVKNCLKCISYSPSAGKGEGFLHCIPKGNVPFDTIHIDHYGPVDKRHLIKRYVFLVVDAFSKHVKLYATKTTSTKEVIHCLSSYFSYYSRPKMIISDRGSCFTSQDFEDFVKDNNVTHVKVATSSPKANGQVERINRLLTPMLAKLTEDSPDKRWYTILEDAEYAINNVINKTTGASPSELLFGVSQRGKTVDGLKEYLNRDKYCTLEEIKHLREKAAEKTLVSQQKNKIYFDKKRKRAYKYKEGDLVMIRNFESTPGVSKKLIPRFKGPYKVIRDLRHDRYLVADIEGFQNTNRPYQGTWEADNMRPWRVDDVS